MAETSFFWNGNLTGDATLSPYDRTAFAEFCLELAGHGILTNLGGVLPSELNSLVPSVVGANVQVASGKAFVYGGYYKSTAAVNVAIPTPVSATRIDLVVVEFNWTTQVGRLVRIPGAEGGGAPSMNQSIGVKWDIPIAQASITTGGVITLTDTRKLVGSTATLAAHQVVVAEGAGTPLVGAGPGAVGIPLIGQGASADPVFGQVVTAGIADQAITTAKYADASITPGKLATGASGINGFIFAYGYSDGAGAVLDSANVTSIVRNSAGDYTINLANAHPKGTAFTLVASLSDTAAGEIQTNIVSASTIHVATYNSADLATNRRFSFICLG